MSEPKEKIILIGGGGYAKVVIDALKSSKTFSLYGIIDSKLPEGSTVSGIKVIGSDDKLPELFKKGIRDAFIGIGSIGNCDVRKRIYDILKKIKFRLPVIVHPKAIVAGDVELGEGTFVAAGAVKNTETKIGKNAIINTSSSIDHDCVIGDFVHIAPGVTLSGGVKVGDEVHIGTGAKVIQYVKIEEKAFVGAGAVIITDVAKRKRTYGQLVRDLPNGKE